MSCSWRNLAIVALASLTLLGGCKKKRPNIPPQAQAPTIPQQQPPAQPIPETLPPAQPQAPSPTPPPVTTTKPKPKPRKRHIPKKPAPPAQDRTIIKEGGDNNKGGQLSAGIPQDEAAHQRQNTAQLRQDTENKLRAINRQLSKEEQSTVQQIRTYIAQSRSADNDGDIERAYNLALKAHLLAGELTKH